MKSLQLEHDQPTLGAGDPAGGLGTRSLRIVGLIAGALAALAVVALGVVSDWAPRFGSVVVHVDQLGLWGVMPAAVAGAVVAPGLRLPGRVRLLTSAAKMSIVSVGLGIAAILLANAIALLALGPSTVGTSDPIVAWGVLLFAAFYALLILGPVTAVALGPLALAWALAVRLVVRLYARPMTA